MAHHVFEQIEPSERIGAARVAPQGFEVCVVAREPVTDRQGRRAVVLGVQDRRLLPERAGDLQKIGSFKKAVSDRESIAPFLRTADDMVAGSKFPMPNSARFFLAYEGMLSVVMAVLEFYEVRPADTGGHRATAIQRVAADLKLDVAEQSVLGRLHDVRNRVTYRAPLPPVTKADADALQAVLERMLPAARALVGI